MKLQRQIFTQDLHSCGDPQDTPCLDVQVMDAGAGEYLVLSAQAWAVDSQGDIDALYHFLSTMLAGCREGGEA